MPLSLLPILWWKQISLSTREPISTNGSSLILIVIEFLFRVVECRLAAITLAKTLKGDEWKNVRRLKDVQTLLNLSLSEMVVYFDCCFNDTSRWKL